MVILAMDLRVPDAVFIISSRTALRGVVVLVVVVAAMVEMEAVMAVAAEASLAPRATAITVALTPT